MFFFPQTAVYFITAFFGLCSIQVSRKGCAKIEIYSPLAVVD
jgi:hypothetical protein